MKRTQGPWSAVLITTLAVAGAIAASAATTHRAETRADDRTCCVANPRHAGICKVQLGEDETCADVLAYLNNANSVGRTYCGNTTVRVGWQQVTCQD